MRRTPFAPRCGAMLALVAVSTMTAGCSQPLPSGRVVIDARVLAVRTEVTGSLIPEDDAGKPPRAQALPLETVRVTPFVVGPEGPYDPADLDAVWIACELTPGLGTLTCIDSALPIALDAIPDCPEVDLMALLMGGELPETVSPCIAAREGSFEFTVPFAPSFFAGGDLELTMIAGTPGGTPTETCITPFLADDYEFPDDCLYTVQRLSVGPLERLLVLAGGFGMELPGIEIPDPADIPDGDRNPRITKLEYQMVDDEGEPMGERVEVADGDTIAAPVESRIRIYTTSPEDDLQSFPVDLNEGETVEEESERYEGDWYRTWGELLNGSSDDPESYNDWILEPGRQDDDARPPEDRAFLYYVVRDGRQGVNWWTLELSTPEPRPEP